ncbi:MAG: FAD-binding oxidoreductase [Proteobacteria bacterium]|nr:FAD-binding oxidoreductase [Pseudomonadota bacterium]
MKRDIRSESARPSSLWLRQALEVPDAPCDALSGHRSTDVAIIGGGYVGLWTAIELKRRAPGIDVVVLEQDICGSGASGRNGGYVLSWWPKAPSLIKQFGRDAARDLIAQSEGEIKGLAEWCTKESVPAQFRHSGWVWGAESMHQDGSWNEAVDACRSLGVGDFELLGRDAVAAAAGTPVFVAGVLDRTAALLHPGHLARGLRAAALRCGVTIFEKSRVARLGRGRPSVLETDDGAIRADTVVLATNAWAAAIPELSRSIVVVSSDMIATQPISKRLESVGWNEPAGVNGSQTMVDYVRTTIDGRILAGKGGLATGFGGRVGDSLFSSSRRAREVLRNFRRLYPHMADLPMDCHWSGPVDRSMNGMPLIGALPRYPHILFGIGWSGNGVGPSRIGGRVLASLALRCKDEWASSPLVAQPRRNFPPEPWRFLGSQIVRKAVAIKDSAETRDKPPGRLVSAVAALAPRGVED